MRIQRASLQLQGLPVSPAQARTLAERSLARTPAGLSRGAGGRIAHLTVDVRVRRTDPAAMAEAIGQAVRAAIRQRLEGS